FFAGGDLEQIRTWQPEHASAIDAYLTRIKARLRTLETLGVPVVAALNGAALGGGLEIALAAHHRIAVRERGVSVGFPEVTLGLLPALGGIARSVRLLGVGPALDRLLLPGRPLDADTASGLGLIDDVVSTHEDLIPAARAWIQSRPEAVQPWDRKVFRLPGGVPGETALAQYLQTRAARLRASTKGAPVPAERAILAAAVRGAPLAIDEAFPLENRHFIEIATARVAKNLIAVRFFDPQEINSGAARPQGVEASTVSRIGVLGAGMMGAGIAYAAARSGMEVELKDVDLDGARRGKDRVRALLDARVDKGRLSTESAERILARVRPTGEAEDLAGVDLVVEAVFESLELKREVLGEIASFAPNALLGTNTSTLPISRIARGLDRPEDVIGIHFFSPVDRMPLVEIIVGEHTGESALARAFDFARMLGKTPIVVNDGRGFFTSRTILAFLDEAVAALGEGVNPATIEQAGRQAGYPAGPLQLMDELTLTLPRVIKREAAEAAEAEGRTWIDHPSAAVIDRMIDEFGREGRAAGAGFHDYENGRRTGPWPGLAKAFGSGDPDVPFEDLKERFLFAEALEAVRALDEGVLRNVADANVGSVLGIGFPAWTGGVLRYIDTYPGGRAGFIRRADTLADRYGQRFLPPASLRARTEPFSPEPIAEPRGRT
ncbi:MAG: enoyl-CoA hydratase/isomerase family protein, partial [Nocardiopsis sp. BM-2018]